MGFWIKHEVTPSSAPHAGDRTARRPDGRSQLARPPISNARSGHRFYRPDVGRWLNRDRLEESSAVNLQAFLSNDPGGDVDVLGLRGFSIGRPGPSGVPSLRYAPAPGRPVPGRPYNPYNSSVVDGDSLADVLAESAERLSPDTQTLLDEGKVRCEKQFNAWRQVRDLSRRCVCCSVGIYNVLHVGSTSSSRKFGGAVLVLRSCAELRRREKTLEKASSPVLVDHVPSPWDAMPRDTEFAYRGMFGESVYTALEPSWLARFLGRKQQFLLEVHFVQI